MRFVVCAPRRSGTLLVLVESCNGSCLMLVDCRAGMCFHRQIEGGALPHLRCHHSPTTALQCADSMNRCHSAWRTRGLLCLPSSMLATDVLRCMVWQRLKAQLQFSLQHRAAQYR